MQRCLFEGHKPVEQAGVGSYAGQSFVVCSECGKVLAVSHPQHFLDYNRSPVAGGRPGTVFWPPPGAN